MTEQEAVEEARRRYGRPSVIRDPAYCAPALWDPSDNAYSVAARGDTWEEAVEALGRRIAERDDRLEAAVARWAGMDPASRRLAHSAFGLPLTRRLAAAGAEP